MQGGDWYYNLGIVVDCATKSSSCTRENSNHNRQVTEKVRVIALHCVAWHATAN